MPKKPKTKLLTTNAAALIIWPHLDPTDKAAMQNARRLLWAAIRAGRFPSTKEKVGRDWLLDPAEVAAYAAAYAAGDIHAGRPRTTGAGDRARRAAIDWDSLEQRAMAFADVKVGELFDADGARWERMEPREDGKNAKRFGRGAQLWMRFEGWMEVEALVAKDEQK